MKMKEKKKPAKKAKAAKPAAPSHLLRRRGGEGGEGQVMKPYKLRKTKKLMARARKLLKVIPRANGEKRVVYACGDCGQLFGRRFIPFGIGRGLTLGACLCQLTGHRPMLTVIETRRSC